MREKLIKLLISSTLIVALIIYDRFFTLTFAFNESSYAVYVDDVFYGNIDDRQEFDKYISEELVRLNDESEYGEVYAPNNYKIDNMANVFDTELSDEEILNIFKADVDFLVDGYKATIVHVHNHDHEEVYADEQQVGELTLQENDEYRVVYTTTREELDGAMNKLLETFIEPTDLEAIRSDSVPTNFTEPGTESTISYEVSGTIRGEDLKIPYKEILTGDELYKSLLFSNESDTEKVHIVEAGETLKSIAADNTLNEKELVAANSSLINENTIIAPGQKLTVDLVMPAVTIDSTKIVVAEEVVPFEVKIIEDDTKLSIEKDEIKEPGSDGTLLKTYEVVYKNGQITSESTVIKSEVVEQSQPRVIVKGTKDPPVSIFSGRPSDISVGIAEDDTVYEMDWGKLTYGGYMSSPYGPRWGTLHDAIDIAGVETGSASRAGADGVVTFAGWSGSYGNLVVIDHLNGVVTYYAHHASLIVEAGDRVVKGQDLAIVGTTGFSTGIHLHFEVIVNGVRLDPETVYDGFH